MYDKYTFTTMGNKCHIKIYKLLVFAVLATSFYSCSKQFAGGRYIGYGNRYWEMYDCLELHADGQFDYLYLVDLYGATTSGVWKEDSDRVILNSLIQDVNDFPLEINILENGKHRDTTMFILQNLNVRLYNWYCIIGFDTIKVESDTFFVKKQTDKIKLTFYVKSKSYPELRQLSLPEHCLALKPPLHLSVRSKTYEVSVGSVLSVRCDPVFGNYPLNYMIFNDKTVIKKKNRLVLSNRILKPSRRCGYAARCE